MVTKNVCCRNVASIHVILDGLDQLDHFLAKVPNKQSNVWLQKLEGKSIPFAPVIVNIPDDNQFGRF